MFKESDEEKGGTDQPVITETISMVWLTQYTHPTKKWLLSLHFDD